jgi:hypothetical protein
MEYLGPKPAASNRIAVYSELGGGGGSSPTVRYEENSTATAGQTIITTTNALTAGYFDLYIQGTRIKTYTLTDSTHITLDNAMKLNDIVNVVIYATLSITPTLPSQGGNGGKVLSTDGSSTSWQLPTISFQTVEINLGVARRNGNFTITSSGLTSGKQVMINQATGPYTGKGSRADETEMDMLIVSGVVTSSTTIKCYWSSLHPVMGNFKFNYLINI